MVNPPSILLEGERTELDVIFITFLAATVAVVFNPWKRGDVTFHLQSHHQRHCYVASFIFVRESWILGLIEHIQNQDQQWGLLCLDGFQRSRLFPENHILGQDVLTNFVIFFCLIFLILS